MDTLPRPIELDWHLDACARVPYRLYTDGEIYDRELERLFYRGHWCYVGLAAEIPNHGDFKRCRRRDALPFRHSRRDHNFRSLRERHVPLAHQHEHLEIGERPRPGEKIRFQRIDA